MDPAEKPSENMSPEAQALFDEAVRTIDATEPSTFGDNKLNKLSTEPPTFGEDKLNQLSTDDLKALQIAIKEKETEAYKAMEKLSETEKTKTPQYTKDKAEDLRQHREYMKARKATNKMLDRYEQYFDLRREVRHGHNAKIQAEAEVLSHDVEEDRANIEKQAAALGELKAEMAKTSGELDQALTETFAKKPPAAKA